MGAFYHERRGYAMGAVAWRLREVVLEKLSWVRENRERWRSH
jgi:hypothetical protein